MRASLIVLGVVAAARVAAASTVVVLSDPGDAPALGSALEVTLAGRGVAIATLPAPGGSLRLDRAAAAQHAALSFNADAALWIDTDAGATEVCAVSADGRYFRHAPLPVGEGDTPRMFAAIATSLLDELLTPDGQGAPAVDVDVHVHVDPHGPQGPVVATLEPPSLAAPAVMQQAITAPAEERVRMDRSLLEIGPMASPITVGVEASLMIPVGRAYRLGVDGLANILPTDSNRTLLGFGGELRHVGRGRHHWDVGPVAGYAFVAENSHDAAFYAGARIAYAWEGEHHGMSASVVPVLFVPTSDTPVPGLYASLHWELPI